jgi:RNA polymerase sigma-70 factor (ECF subfamily)
VHDQEEGLAGESALAWRQAALAGLVEAYQQPLGSYVLHLVGRLDVALALTQETFVHAYRAETAHPPELAIRPWLYREATRLAYRHLRRAQQPGPLSIPVPEAPLWPSAAASTTTTSAERALVESVLRDLELGERAVLLLCDLEQFPYPAAAAILGLTSQGLDRRLARARAHFRRASLAHHALRDA